MHPTNHEDGPVVRDELERRRQVKEAIEKALSIEDLSDTPIAWRDPEKR